MCTAATYKTRDFYFGRTLDYEFSYGDEVTITPRNFPFHFGEAGEMNSHYAIIGMAHVAENYPLYYEAANEKGLCIAGLNFVGNAHYRPGEPGKNNIAQFELIPWLLGQCANVEEAKKLLGRINITDRPFGKFPLAQLHWMIADRDACIVVESVRDGLKIYENPVGVMTNNPTFDMQLFQLNNYMQLSAKSPANSFGKGLELQQYSRGLGAMGLPGDLSSQSRFIRAAFVKMNSVSSEDERESVGQFFHILSSVEAQRGCCILEDEKYDITLYTCCINADKGIYYYTTYGNRRISAVDMGREDLDSAELMRWPLAKEEDIFRQN